MYRCQKEGGYRVWVGRLECLASLLGLWLSTSMINLLTNVLLLLSGHSRNTVY